MKNNLTFFRNFALETICIGYTMKIKDITCSSPIEAEGLRSALWEMGIESNVFDETNSKVARGILDQRTDVLVKEEDYEQAMKVYQSYLAEQKNVMPWCPKCGSENVAAVPTDCCLTKKFVCNDCGHKWKR